MPRTARDPRSSILPTQVMVEYTKLIGENAAAVEKDKLLLTTDNRLFSLSRFLLYATAGIFGLLILAALIIFVRSRNNAVDDS